MFLLRRPSRAQIERFLDQSRTLPLSVSPIDLDAKSGEVDELVAVIGHGAAGFDRARSALLAWKQFDVGWVQVFTKPASIAPGTIVGVLIRHFGIWSLNGGRVLDGPTARDDRPSFGFQYATLTNHAESGQELFEVSLDPPTQDVVYRIRAVSRPQSPLAWAGYPVVRLLQERFRRDSAAAMKRALA